MMENQTVFACPQCGGVAHGFREGRTDGVRCTQCDWSVATTHTPPIKLDLATYEVLIERGDFRDAKQVKAVASVTGGNFLSARNLLKTSQMVVFNGDAQHVLQVRDALLVAGVVVAIHPEFPW